MLLVILRDAGADAAAPAMPSIAPEAAIDSGAERMQMAGMVSGFPPFAGLLRTVALAVFAVLLLTRLGPFCEATARAAPIASSMTGCEGKKMPASDKKATWAVCATPCMAVPGEALGGIDPLPMTAVVLWPSLPSGIDGSPVPPATPPPRAV